MSKPVVDIARMPAAGSVACLRSRAGCLLTLVLSALLLSSAAIAQDAQAGSVAQQAQQQREQSEESPPQTRGVSTHAAREAISSLEQQQDPQAERVDAGDAASSAPVAASTAVAGETSVASVAQREGMAPERGVLFRITPPAPVQLPAEAMISEAGTAAGEPAAPQAKAVAATAPSYLLGTIHFGTPDEQGIDYDRLGTLAGEVDTFVNEADIDEPWKPEYDGYRWLPVETPLSGLVGKDDMALARALLPAVRPEDLERMKPWAVLSLLEARGENGGEVTMDARLQRMASAAGKRMVHLETLEQQLQALDCVPATEHAQVLDERLQRSWILRIESAEAMAFYRTGNLDAWLANIDEMEGLTDGARQVEQRARHCLLEERNARWIGQLQTLFQDGPCLVAVGAIHLVGNDGLIARLRRDGYRVEALQP